MSAWKACDIRGRFPGEVSPQLFREVGRAAASQLGAGDRVLVAGDFRLSTPALKTALIDGLAEGGLRVADAGQIPTPVSYHAYRTGDYAAVFMVTASHNPADYNGLKMMIGHLPPDEELFTRLRQPSAVTSRVRGSVEAVEVVTSYRQWTAKRWRHLGQQFPGSIVIDAGNGAWSELAPRIMADLGLVVHPLFCTIDARFPNRPPDSARSSHLAALSQLVPARGAQLGIAWDGDGDRVALVDAAGRFVSADQMSILLARYQLDGQPGLRVAYDIKLSERVRQAIEAAGGVALMQRSGHSFLKRMMIEEECLLGCEASGHYFHRELGGGDDGLYTALLMLELVARCGAMHDLTAGIPEIFVTPDLRIPARQEAFDSIAARLERQLPVLQMNRLDGVRFVTPDGTVLVRRSITEPAITIRIDARQKDRLDYLVDECCRSLPEMADEMKAQIDQSRAR